VTNYHIEVRVADSEDAEYLSEIGFASFRAAYEGSCSTAELEGHLAMNFAATVIREQLQQPGHTYLLATVDSGPAGFVKLRDANTPEEIPGRSALEIQQFYVSPNHQRLGLGGRLMQAALGIVKEDSFAGAWLSVWENAGWATSFYLGHGFKKVGTANFTIGSTVHNDFLMWRAVANTSED